MNLSDDQDRFRLQISAFVYISKTKTETFRVASTCLKRSPAVTAFLILVSLLAMRGVTNSRSLWYWLLSNLIQFFRVS